MSSGRMITAALLGLAATTAMSFNATEALTIKRNDDVDVEVFGRQRRRSYANKATAKKRNKFYAKCR